MILKSDTEFILTPFGLPICMSSVFKPQSEKVNTAEKLLLRYSGHLIYVKPPLSKLKTPRNHTLQAIMP